VSEAPSARDEEVVSVSLLLSVCDWEVEVFSDVENEVDSEVDRDLDMLIDEPTLEPREAPTAAPTGPPAMKPMPAPRAAPRSPPEVPSVVDFVSRVPLVLVEDSPEVWLWESDTPTVRLLLIPSVRVSERVRDSCRPRVT